MPNYTMTTDSILTLDGLTLTEHNRSPLSVDFEHLNRSQRTVEGYMRRQHIAMKRTWAVSWEDLPNTSAYTVDQKYGAQQMVGFLLARMDEALTLEVSKDAGVTHDTYTVLIEALDYEITRRYEFEYWNISLNLIEV